MLGLYSPFKYGLKEHEGYDIAKFRNNIRFLYVIEDRDNGAGGQICPLFFDGAVSVFTELPLPSNKPELEKCLEYIETVVRRRTNYTFMKVSIKKSTGKKWKRNLYRLIKLIRFAH